MSEEWGPWIRHNVEGDLPLIPMGAVVLFEFKMGSEVLDEFEKKWTDHSAAGFYALCQKLGAEVGIRYRIRKPRGLTMLERVARDVTAPIEQVDA